MLAESFDEDNERASCAPEMLHVYPLREEGLVVNKRLVPSSGLFEDMKYDLKEDLEAQSS
jgi:hypothetical protein